MSTTNTSNDIAVTNEDIRTQLIDDYRLVCLSREASLLGRKEVLTGKAKFGIFGDGKELAQIALSKVYRHGDFRSGYYRDQTLMMALGELTVKQYFAALYAHTNVEKEPTSGGRQMGGHYATRFLDDNGNWKKQTEMYNSSADVSPTGSQMPRLLGLAQASSVYRQNPDLKDQTDFSHNGDEVAFGTIGDASTSEGLFWESVNAAAVLQVPMALSVWDDGYGISVPKKFQTVRESISQALSGFQKADGTNGIKIFVTRGWDYPHLVATYEKAIQFCRETHTPVLIHVEEMTQPQGHSTSGSHERYKSEERLAWAIEYDCINQLGKFLILEGAANEEELEAIRKEAKKQVRNEQKEAWADYRREIDADRDVVVELIGQMATSSESATELNAITDGLKNASDPIRRDLFVAAHETLKICRSEDTQGKSELQDWVKTNRELNDRRYSSHLYSESPTSVGNIPVVPAEYPKDPESVDGRIILRENFREIFKKYPTVLTFGEDTGKIGGVNQAMEGMQDEFGEVRVSDTGIREASIIGQGIGMAMRGLRPIAEIQYLDYLYYALQIMRDDLATVQYRTIGGQKSPLIVRTRGHRLEGIWHSGSPMGAIIHSLRGINICVPRNMTQAAGMYNTLLQSDEPALLVECLNGYRKKEPLPSNLGEFTVPLGVAEVVREGSDVTVVSYGSTLNICLEVSEQLQESGISVEIVDVQTLLPFDRNKEILASVQKTNRLIFIDEDVSGGATGYMMDQAFKQGAFKHLDSEPRTLSAKPHLPAYGTDGDFFSKPSDLDIFNAIYSMMHEVDPHTFPSIY
jgi:pyruvate/2-oxoglutarate/acetoin dehydrogenase E1 component/TPP-dependent pyruvate/acetoin dehydrogenase alpha subunit